jgi:hypothetical protein
MSPTSLSPAATRRASFRCVLYSSTDTTKVAAAAAAAAAGAAARVAEFGRGGLELRPAPVRLLDPLLMPLSGRRTAASDTAVLAAAAAVAAVPAVVVSCAPEEGEGSPHAPREGCGAACRCRRAPGDADDALDDDATATVPAEALFGGGGGGCFTVEEAPPPPGRLASLRRAPTDAPGSGDAADDDADCGRIVFFSSPRSFRAAGLSPVATIFSRRLMERVMPASLLLMSSLFVTAVPPVPIRAMAFINSEGVGTFDEAALGARRTCGGGGGGFTPRRTCSLVLSTRASSWCLREASPGVPLRRYASVVTEDALRMSVLARSSCLLVSSSKRRRSLARTLPPVPHVMVLVRVQPQASVTRANPRGSLN